MKHKCDGCRRKTNKAVPLHIRSDGTPLTWMCRMCRRAYIDERFLREEDNKWILR